MAGEFSFGGGSAPSFDPTYVDPLEQERVGARLTLLQRYLPELTRQSPEVAIGLASANTSEDDLITTALDTSAYVDVRRTIAQLRDAPPEYQRAVFLDMPKEMQTALQRGGFNPMQGFRRPEDDDGGGFSINLPDRIGPVNLPDEVHVGGGIPGVEQAAGALQHAGGEALEAGLGGLSAVSRVPGHLFRMSDYLSEESSWGLPGFLGAVASLTGMGSPSALSHVLTNPTAIGRAWRETSDGEHYFDESARTAAMDTLEGDAELYDLASRVAAGDQASEIAEDLGLAPDTQEWSDLVLRLYELQGEDRFMEAVDQLNDGKVSPGRRLANQMGFQETDSGFGRWLSGAWDAAVAWYADPTLIAGRLNRARRAMMWSANIETPERIERIADHVSRFRAARADDARRATSGLSRQEWGRARAVNEAVQRISDAFAGVRRNVDGTQRSIDLPVRHPGTGEVVTRTRPELYTPADLFDEMPQTMTAWDDMVEFHNVQLNLGQRGLDTVEGVMDWMSSVAGRRALGSGQLGGRSNDLVELPHLTRRGLTNVATRRFMREGLDFTASIDARRIAAGLRETDVAVGTDLGTLGERLTQALAGPPARFLRGLSTHTPREGVLPLYGPQAIRQFDAYVAAGDLGWIPPATLREFRNAFIGERGADGIIRTNVALRNRVATDFTQLLMRRMGAPEEMIERWVTRQNQVFSSLGHDPLNSGATTSAAAILPDAQRASMMSIPRFRELVAASRKDTFTRSILGSSTMGQADAVIGRYWKPAVLLRLGFIARAAGEEALAFTLRSIEEIPRSMVFAPWIAEDQLRRFGSQAGIRFVDPNNTAAVMTPIRYLTRSADHMMRSAFRTPIEEASTLRRGLARLTASMDTMAYRTAVGMGETMHWIAERAPFPLTRAEVAARFLDPTDGRVEAARSLIAEPTIARFFMDEMGGTSYLPLELQAAKSPWRSRQVFRAGQPTPRVVDVPTQLDYSNFTFWRRPGAKPRPGQLGEDDAALRNLDSFYKSMMSLYGQWLDRDRVGRSLADVMRNFVSAPMTDELARHAPDVLQGADPLATAQNVRQAIWDLPEAGRNRILGWIRESPATRDDRGVIRARFEDWVRTSGFDNDELLTRARAALDVLEADTLTARPMYWLSYRPQGEAITSMDDLVEQMFRSAIETMQRPDLGRHVDEMLRANAVEGRRVPHAPAPGLRRLVMPTVHRDQFAAALEIFRDSAAARAFAESLATRLQRMGRGFDELDELLARLAPRGGPTRDLPALMNLQDQLLLQGANDYVPFTFWASTDEAVVQAVVGALDDALEGGRHAASRLAYTDVAEEALKASSGPYSDTVVAWGDDWRTSRHFDLGAPHLTHYQAVDPARLQHLYQVDTINPLNGERVLRIVDEEELARLQAPMTSRERQILELRAPGLDDAAVRRSLDDAGIFEAHPIESLAELTPAQLDQVEAALRSGLNRIADEIDATIRGASSPARARTLERAQESHERVLAALDRAHRTPEGTLHSVAAGDTHLAALESIAAKQVEDMLNILTTRNRASADDVLHEVLEPFGRSRADGTTAFDLDNFSEVPMRDLPSHVHGPVVVQPEDLAWDRFVREGFDTVIGPAIAAIVRKPLFVAEYGKAVDNLRWLSDELLDAGVAESAQRVLSGLAGDPGDVDVFARRLIEARRLVDQVGPDGEIADGMRELAELHRLIEDPHGRVDDVNRMLSRLFELGDPEVVAAMASARGSADRATRGFFATARDPYGAWRSGTIDPAELRAVQELAKVDDELAIHLMTLDTADELADAAQLRRAAQGVQDRLQAMAAEPRATARRVATSVQGHEEVLDGEGLDVLRRFIRQRGLADDAVRDSAIQRTFETVQPYIDDHRVRSQFQEWVGNMIPFWFAEEQFLRRWVRTLAETPEALRRGQLLMNGFRNMGVVRPGPDGEEVFVYPGATLLTNTLAETAELITGQPFTVPMSTAFTGQVRYMLPGIGDQMGVPSVGPLVGLSLALISRRFPEFQEVEHNLVGDRGQRESLLQYIAPTTVTGLLEAVTSDPDRGALASAQMQAIAQLAADGHVPPPNASAAEQEEFTDRVRNHARIILIMRRALGWVGPTTGQPETRGDWLSAEFRDLLNESDDFEGALSAFLNRHPDATPYTIFGSEVPSGAPLATTAEAFDWVNQHETLIESFPMAMPWLMPQPDGRPEFEVRAWRQQIANEMRQRRTPQEFLDEIRFAEAAPEYFDSVDRYEAAREAASDDPTRRDAIDESFQNWAEGYKNQHPTFRDLLQSPERAQRRAEVLSQMRVLVDSPDLVSPQLESMRTVIDSWDRFQVSISALSDDRHTAAELRRDALRTSFIRWIEDYARDHPEVSAFYQRVIRPEIGIDHVEDVLEAEQEEG